MRERSLTVPPNEASITRLIGTLLLDHHERWISGKAYFAMGDYLFEKDSSELAGCLKNRGNET